jgi:hypothetical protein
MENAIQSFLQVSGIPPADVARALLLRAKTRLAAGYRTSAQQGQIHAYPWVPRNALTSLSFRFTVRAMFRSRKSRR